MSMPSPSAPTDAFTFPGRGTQFFRVRGRRRGSASKRSNWLNRARPKHLRSVRLLTPVSSILLSRFNGERHPASADLTTCEGKLLRSLGCARVSYPPATHCMLALVD